MLVVMGPVVKAHTITLSSRNQRPHVLHTKKVKHIYMRKLC